MKFEDLKIIDPLLRALKDKGYHTPTEIQSRAIPHILQRRDILGCAQTGTGKTAAFALPIIQLINQIEGHKKDQPKISSLILTPTRELAIQIEENLKAYAKYTSIRHAVIYGGVKQGPQVGKIKKGVHVLVATPGRLLDLVNQGIVNLDDIKVFVLDEADRMLDMGFINDIRKIIRLLPADRQSLFFSATMPDNILDLSHTILKDPIKVEASPPSSTAETVTQYIYYTNRADKQDLLLHILKNDSIDHALVFTRTKRGADGLTKFLQRNEIKAAAIHGDKAQNQRQKSLTHFKTGNLRILVATNIAARGIDINELKYVINYEIPNEPESYVHRIGRSGRAGKEGVSISLCEPEENIYVRDIQGLIKQKIEIVQDNPFPQTEKPMTTTQKKEWNKEKEEKKRASIASRKAKRNDGFSKSGQRKNKNLQEDKTKNSKQGSSRDDDNRKRKSSQSSPNKMKDRNYRRNKTSSSSRDQKMRWPLEK